MGLARRNRLTNQQKINILRLRFKNKMDIDLIAMRYDVPRCRITSVLYECEGILLEAKKSFQKEAENDLPQMSQEDDL